MNKDKTFQRNLNAIFYIYSNFSTFQIHIYIFVHYMEFQR